MSMLISGRDTRRPRRLLAGLASTLLLALTALVGATTLTGGGAAQAAAEDDAVIRIALPGSTIDTFNPFVSIYLTPTGINRMVYENLVAYGTNNEAVPGLAEEWEASEDAKTWTFTIGEDRSWSDGEPVTADDVVWTIQAILDDPDGLGANSSLVTNVDSISAEDEQTVVMELKEPQASNPGFEIPVVPEHIWSEIDDPSKYPNDTDVVGSGPYLMKSYEPDRSIELVANENYWRGAPELDGIDYVFYRNVDASVRGLQAGEVDMVNDLTPAQFDSLENADNITTHAGAGRRYTALAINPGAVDADGEPMGNGNPALEDIDLRTAIMMAIDKQKLVDTVLGGYGEPGQTEIPTVYEDFFGYADGTEVLEFDLDGANDLLDEAGYEMGSDGVRSDLDGNPLELRLMGDSEDSDHVRMSEFVSEWLEEIGIKVERDLVGGDQVGTDSTLGNYDMYFTSWSLGPDPDFQLSINTCASRPNADGSGSTSENNWCSPEFDEIFAEQHAELDQETRSGLVKEAFSTLYEARVNQPIWYAESLEAYRSDRFDGFTLQPEGEGPILGQNGYWGLYGAEPASGAAAADDGGLPGWVLPVGGVVIVAAAGLAFLASRRRSATADERE